MRTDQKGLKFLAAVLLFSCCVIPLSHASDETQPPSRQQLLSIVNLSGESSAGAVVQANGVIEFQGNELVNSIAKTMAASGSLPLDSALAIPKDARNMMQGTQIPSTPLALVERDLQTEIARGGVALDAIIKNAATLSREPIGVPLNNIIPAENFMNVNAPAVIQTPAVVTNNLGAGVGSGRGVLGVSGDGE